jgi:hypothetical protein
VWTGTSVPAGLVTREVPLDVVPVYCRSEAWPTLADIFSR